MTRISRQQLESYLWRAATLLRGGIDAVRSADRRHCGPRLPEGEPWWFSAKRDRHNISYFLQEPAEIADLSWGLRGKREAFSI